MCHSKSEHGKKRKHVLKNLEDTTVQFAVSVAIPYEVINNNVSKFYFEIYFYINLKILY
jgi:hypothetical protein